MRVANLADVKNDLSRFVAMVRRGARVRILVRGVPAADLVPIEPAATNENDELEIRELEALGLVRRGRPLTAAERRELERPGPRVRGAVEALIAERRESRR